MVNHLPLKYEKRVSSYVGHMNECLSILLDLGRHLWDNTVVDFQWVCRKVIFLCSQFLIATRGVNLAMQLRDCPDSLQ